MPAKNPRINVVLEESIYEKVKLLAEKEETSLSAKVRDLLIEALEIQEDIHLAQLAEDREKSWNKDKALAHDEIWN